MKNKFTRLLLCCLALVIVSSGCSRKEYSSNSYLGYKKRWYKWHSHGAKPRAHHGGYW